MCQDGESIYLEGHIKYSTIRWEKALCSQVHCQLIQNNIPLQGEEIPHSIQKFLPVLGTGSVTDSWDLAAKLRQSALSQLGQGSRNPFCNTKPQCQDLKYVQVHETGLTLLFLLWGRVRGIEMHTCIHDHSLTRSSPHVSTRGPSPPVCLCHPLLSH
jgi:hypothetical protein